MLTIKLNGIQLKRPTTFDIERYKITDATRVSSGDMHMDFIANKRKFLFYYSELSGEQLEELMSIFETDDVFYTLEYTENGRTKTATVYVGPIKARHARSHYGWYWKDVTFNLIER